MSKLEKLPIFFISIDELVKLYIKNEKISLNNLGVFINRNTILSQVLYSNNEVITVPYTLKVDKSTYIKKREKVLIYIIEEIIVKNHQIGSRGGTISSKIANIIKFINWANENNLCFINSLDNAINVFWQYTYYLKDRIRLGTYIESQAQRNQSEAYKMLSTLFNDKKNRLLAGNKITTSRKNNNKLEKSSEEDQKYHFNFCYHLFHQLTDFLLEQKEYPLKLNLPNGDVWCLPSSNVYIKNDKESPIAFNFDTGTIRSAEDIYNIKNYKYLSKAIRIRKDFLNQLKKHNLDYMSQKRLLLGQTALMAYYLCFLTITQMNDSTAATLLWNDDYQIEKNKQKFKTIKYRAGNKPVEFQLQNKSIKDFQKFLKLRDYLLDGNDFKYLFFQKNGKNAELSNHQKLGSFSATANKKFIKHIDPKLPRLNSRKLRVNKTHQVIKKDGIIAASQLAQSSITTMIDSYLGESQESTDEQLGEYFKLLNQNIFKQENNEKDISVGRCRSPDQPESDIEIKGIDIDCSKGEGCLFCKHYGLHADEEDIKKIYSLKYIINESRYISKNENHFLDVYGVVIERIDDIIEQIIKESKQDKKSMDLFEKDVFENENLHPYWEHKLNTLIKMGVLK